MSALDPQVRGRVQRLYARLENPTWMPQPRSWVWRRPDGQAQGFGPTWFESPGRANLLWLALNLRRPPAEYDANHNDLYMAILLQGDVSKLAGEPLTDMAGLHSLRCFHALLAGEAPRNGTQLEQMYPLLKMLVGERLRDAHP